MVRVTVKARMSVRVWVMMKGKAMVKVQMRVKVMVRVHKSPHNLHEECHVIDCDRYQISLVSSVHSSLTQLTHQSSYLLIHPLITPAAIQPAQIAQPSAHSLPPSFTP